MKKRIGKRESNLWYTPIITLVIGSVISSVATSQILSNRFQKRENSLRKETQNLELSLSNLKKEKAEWNDNAPENEITRLKNQIFNLEETIANFDTDYETYISPEEYTEPIEVSTLKEEEPIKEEQNRRYQGNENLTPEQRQERETQMRTRFEEMQNRNYERTIKRVEKYNDPNWQQREVDIYDSSQRTMELLGQMREATTDEKRGEIMNQVREEGIYSQTLREEQKNYELKQIASEFGINSEREQNQLINRLNEVNSNQRVGMMSFGGRSGRDSNRGPPQR